MQVIETIQIETFEIELYEVELKSPFGSILTKNDKTLEGLKTSINYFLKDGYEIKGDIKKVLRLQVK
jgi:hypothetical protein